MRVNTTQNPNPPNEIVEKLGAEFSVGDLWARWPSGLERRPATRRSMVRVPLR